MGNAPGAYRPDGRPARQFGDEIIEPGEPFSGDTLDVIRSLIDEPAGGDLHGLQEPEPEPETEPESKPDDGVQLDTPVPSVEKSDQVENQDHAELTQAILSAGLVFDQADTQTFDTAVADTDVAPKAMDQAVSLSLEPEISLPDNITQFIKDLDRFADEKLTQIEAGNEIEKGRKPLPDMAEAKVSPAPPQMWPVRTKPEWRKLNVVEGAPGRAVRRFCSKPRNLSLLMLIGISIWRPWFIPTLTFVIFLTVVLVAISVGPDRVAAFNGWWFARLKRRNPKKADRLIRRGNWVLRRVEGLADRLPPAWVAGFYLPELDDRDNVADDDAVLKARFERIASQEQIGPA